MDPSRRSTSTSRAADAPLSADWLRLGRAGHCPPLAPIGQGLKIKSLIGRWVGANFLNTKGNGGDQGEVT